METSEKELTPEESFKIIQTMIDTARNKVAEDGFHLMLWGVLVILCCVANYLLIQANAGNWSGIPWLLMPCIGVPAGILYEKSRSRSQQIKSHTDLYVANMWMAYLFSLVFMIVFCSFSQMSPVPFILIITGMATFATGKILKFTPLLIGGIVFWLSALLCLKVLDERQLIIQAVSTFLGYIIPGILLWRNYKAETNVQTT